MCCGSRQAETQKRLQGMLNDLSNNQVFEKFESKLLDTEAMNAAQEELNASSLEQQFEALEANAELDVDQELEALKHTIAITIITPSTTTHSVQDGIPP